MLRDALKCKPVHQGYCAQVTAATVQWHAQVADLQRQLVDMAAAVAAAAAKMDAPELRLLRTPLSRVLASLKAGNNSSLHLFLALALLMHTLTIMCAQTTLAGRAGLGVLSSEPLNMTES